MPYDDDVDDLFGEEFDFVDDDEEESSADDSKLEAEEKPAPKSRKPAPSRGKPAPAPRPRGKAPSAGSSREAREPREARDSRDRARDEAPAPPAETASDFDDRPPADEPDEAPAPPAGAPADHCVHIYQYGKLKRTIPRKFTDEEAVSFAEEYTRTGKAYGRYAIATPDDEQPAEEFADAAKG